MAELSTHQVPHSPAKGPLQHVAIIMDGNGRWAKERGMPRAIGHRMGVEAVRRTVRAAIELNVTYLTIYSFSSENWSRPIGEINDLMGLMKRFIRRDLQELHKTGVAIKMIGARNDVDHELLTLVEDAEKLTRNNTKLRLVIAFNYGARDEIARAARHLAAQVAEGTLSADQITAEAIHQRLDTVGMPDPDLLIRTGGEQRLSNFLLWQCAYTEFVFLDDYWPDFGRKQLEHAITLYQGRERRYGGLTHHNSVLTGR